MQPSSKTASSKKRPVTQVTGPVIDARYAVPRLDPPTAAAGLGRGASTGSAATDFEMDASELDDGSGGGGTDKAQMRKQRNRESAAASRGRAREYTKGLEDQVTSLTSRIHELEAEVTHLRGGGGGAAAVPGPDRAQSPSSAPRVDAGTSNHAESRRPRSNSDSGAVLRPRESLLGGHIGQQVAVASAASAAAASAEASHQDGYDREYHDNDVNGSNGSRDMQYQQQGYDHAMRVDEQNHHQTEPADVRTGSRRVPMTNAQYAAAISMGRERSPGHGSANVEGTATNGGSSGSTARGGSGGRSKRSANSSKATSPALAPAHHVAAAGAASSPSSSSSSSTSVPFGVRGPLHANNSVGAGHQRGYGTDSNDGNNGSGRMMPFTAIPVPSRHSSYTSGGHPYDDRAFTASSSSSQPSYPGTWSGHASPLPTGHGRLLSVDRPQNYASSGSSSATTFAGQKGQRPRGHSGHSNGTGGSSSGNSTAEADAYQYQVGGRSDISRNAAAAADARMWDAGTGASAGRHGYSDAHEEYGQGTQRQPQQQHLGRHHEIADDGGGVAVEDGGMYVDGNGVARYIAGGYQHNGSVAHQAIDTAHVSSRGDGAADGNGGQSRGSSRGRGRTRSSGGGSRSGSSVGSGGSRGRDGDVSSGADSGRTSRRAAPGSSGGSSMPGSGRITSAAASSAAHNNGRSVPSPLTIPLPQMMALSRSTSDSAAQSAGQTSSANSRPGSRASRATSPAIALHHGQLPQQQQHGYQQHHVHHSPAMKQKSYSPHLRPLDNPHGHQPHQSYLQPRYIENNGNNNNNGASRGTGLQSDASSDADSMDERSASQSRYGHQDTGKGPAAIPAGASTVISTRGSDGGELEHESALVLARGFGQ